ncbi:hypothetical protein [Corticimicrobacter populi]|uniref:Uncharacterized protein n=1 Tax=Corticimicrobacter populi TaxID=2175229 RepID=A0A2V1K3V7_9BURK|nr:hypothetical protein [Corticimicrobacter populi]PWF24913.1 hypothetical protein DD235_01675 [Corticimicrobacter populi]
MSEHDYFIYPRQPHLPPPDWRALEKRLLHEGYIVPNSLVETDTIPYTTLFKLYRQLLLDSEVAVGERSIKDLLQRMQAANMLPAGMVLPAQPTGELLADVLRPHGIDLQPGDYMPHGADHASPIYYLGPATEARLATAETASGTEYFRPSHHTPMLELLEYHRKAYVPIGENLEEPRLPDHEIPIQNYAPFENHIDLIQAAWEDPALLWRSPENGQDYRILDLDWEHTFGLGYRMVRLSSISSDLLPELTALVSEVTGVPMQWHHCHL